MVILLIKVINLEEIQFGKGVWIFRDYFCLKYSDLIMLVIYLRKDSFWIVGNVRLEIKGCGRDWLNVYQFYLFFLGIEEGCIFQFFSLCLQLYDQFDNEWVQK